MKCTCDIKALMDNGCLCGGFEREQALKKQKPDEKESIEKPGDFVRKKTRVSFWDPEGQEFFMDVIDEDESVVVCSAPPTLKFN